MRWFRVELFSLLVLLLGVAFVSVSRQPVRAKHDESDDDTEIISVRRDGHDFQTRITREAPDPELGRPSRAGSLLVKFRADARQSERDEADRAAGALKIDRLYLKDTQRVQVRDTEVAEALERYRRNPAVEYVVPDRMVRALLMPSDPRFGEQWGMTTINAPGAWDTSTSSADTRVAILDCGVYDSASTFISPDGNPGHPDVRDKVVARVNFTSSPDADDWCNHGTHVAGIAAASTNNGIGVAGTGYNASVVNVKVLGDTGSGSFDWVINGILWAAGCDTTPCGPRRAEIINMSLGATGACDPLVQTAIDTAWTQGLVIVAAAGNIGTSGAITPANCTNVVGVSASDKNDAKASFSNFGSGVDVAAPGVRILSTDYVGRYASFSGTSMASPHVAGQAALIWTTPYNTGNQAVVDRIFQTANANALAGSTFGRIDAQESVASGGPTPSPTPTPTSTPSPTPTPTPTLTPTPPAASCTAPVITSHSDTNPTGGGTVSFTWNPVAGASSYRIQRQRSDGSWQTRATKSSTSFTGSDTSTDPDWRVFVYSGSCTPIPGPATVFDP
jgi:thermitase